MKKVILGIVALMITLGVATTSVNAASLKTDKPEYVEGETVVFTVDMEKTRSVGIKLSYDAESLEYASISTDTNAFNVKVTDKGNGNLVVAGYDEDGNDANTIGQVTIKFTAKKDAENAKIEVTSFDVDGEDTLAEASKIIKVSKKTEEPTTPVEPENPVKPTEEPTKPVETQKPNTKPTGTEKPTKLPQTGVPYVAIAVAGIVIIAGAVTLSKIKNK